MRSFSNAGSAKIGFHESGRSVLFGQFRVEGGVSTRVSPVAVGYFLLVYGVKVRRVDAALSLYGLDRVSQALSIRLLISIS